MQVYQWLHVDAVPPAQNFVKNKTLAEVFFCESAYIFIKNETLRQVFSCEFWEIFHSAIILKTGIRHRWFLVIFGKPSAYNFDKTRLWNSSFPVNFAIFVRTVIL